MFLGQGSSPWLLHSYSDTSTSGDDVISSHVRGEETEGDLLSAPSPYYCSVIKFDSCTQGTCMCVWYVRVQLTMYYCVHCPCLWSMEYIHVIVCPLSLAIHVHHSVLTCTDQVDSMAWNI